ncbi:transcriptional regulator [Umezawaea beigongshangensis]|uniref:transcriptional regulator n=1 Tax=Umezawaea beigongshangensis TaxID=2780383 RepID=UPI0018F1BB42|nr:transcriptional regulator [Umezawaea beigongshangensis]
MRNTRAAELVERAREDLAPAENRLVALVESGDAGLDAVGALAAEQQRVIRSDWRTFLHLAGSARDASARTFFTSYAQGEAVALDALEPLARACGWDADRVAAHRPQPGCQAYPAFLSWLSAQRDTADALLAVLVNFPAWGGYCARLSTALRARHGFGDAACAFFDFFATPVPELEELALTAVQNALDSGWDPAEGLECGRLLQGYEIMFWDTLADRTTA